MSVNNATGVPEINIPLHVIQIDGVKIPISISYQATGIRVNDVPTQVGVNWMLNAGGLVSRNILGLPDEQGNGGWFNFFNDNGEPDVTEETCDLHKLEGYYKGTHDASPDIYSYQFGGYSGGFFFYNEDSIVKIGGQELIMNVTFPFSANFTDRYGNNYFFNEHTSIDQTNVIRYGGNSETSTGFQITANRLDLIETYLGKTIEFDYEPKSDTIVTRSYEAEKNIDNNDANLNEVFNKTKYTTWIVKSITTDYEEVIFVNESHEQLPNDPLRLKKILVIDRINQDTVKTVNFGHSVYSRDPRLKLTDLTICNHGSDGSICKDYSFTYHAGKLVDAEDVNQDIFGYYNRNDHFGHGDTHHLIPVSKEIADFPYTPANREVDHERIKHGVLKKIKYPTGGVTTFEFEPNSSMTQTGSVIYFPGLRIKRIRDFDVNGKVYNERFFSYDNPIKLPNSTYHEPFEFGSHYKEQIGTQFYNNIQKWSCSPYKFNEYHFAFLPAETGFYYGKINIREKDGRVTTEKYEGYKEGFQLRPRLKKQLFFDNNDSLVKNVEFFYEKQLGDTVTGYFPTDSYLRCGYFTCHEVEHNWLGCVSFGDDNYEPFLFFDKLVPVDYTGLDYHRLVGKETTEYFEQSNHNTITTIHEYEYNQDGMLVSEKSWQEGNDYAYKNRFFYLGDLNVSTAGNVYYKMHEKNMIGFEVERSRVIGHPSNNSNDKQIAGTLTKYKEFGDIVKPWKQYAFETDAPAPPSSITVNSSGTLNFSEKYQEKVNFNDYDEKGNLLQYKRKDGIYTSFLWGYDSAYPIVKIENAEFQEVENYLHNMNWSVEDLQSVTTDSYLIAFFEDFLDHLPEDVQATFYTHKPLAGVTSVTDSRGQTAYFDYSKGLLTGVKDNEGNILNQYQYNYAGPQEIEIPEEYSLSFDITYEDSQGNPFQPYGTQHKIIINLNNTNPISSPWITTNHPIIFNKPSLVSGEHTFMVKIRNMTDTLKTTGNLNFEIDLEGGPQTITRNVILEEEVSPQVPEPIDYESFIINYDPDTDKISLLWDPAADAQDYQVQRKPNWGGMVFEGDPLGWTNEWIQLGSATNSPLPDPDDPPTSEQIQHESNPDESNYQITLNYRIRARNQFGSSEWIEKCGIWDGDSLIDCSVE